MYLSYDTQELVWTGFQVLGDELDNYTVESNNVSTPGATHNTGDIFGGDTLYVDMDIELRIDLKYKELLLKITSLYTM